MVFFSSPINNYRRSNGSPTLQYLGCQEPDDGGVAFFSKEQRQGWGSSTLFKFTVTLSASSCLHHSAGKGPYSPSRHGDQESDEASSLTHSSQNSSTGERGCISSPPRELWLPSPKGSPPHCCSPRYCSCQDPDQPQTFRFAADISEAEDKTLNKEKVVSSCRGTEQQKAQHTQPLP